MIPTLLSKLKRYRILHLRPRCCWNKLTSWAKSYQILKLAFPDKIVPSMWTTSTVHSSWQILRLLALSTNSLWRQKGWRRRFVSFSPSYSKSLDIIIWDSPTSCNPSQFECCRLGMKPWSMRGKGQLHKLNTKGLVVMSRSRMPHLDSSSTWGSIQMERRPLKISISKLIARYCTNVEHLSIGVRWKEY